MIHKIYELLLNLRKRITRLAAAEWYANTIIPCCENNTLTLYTLSRIACQTIDGFRGIRMDGSHLHSTPNEQTSNDTYNGLMLQYVSYQRYTISLKLSIHRDKVSYISIHPVR